MPENLPELSKRLAELADEVDLSGDWPARSLDVLTEFGCWKWWLPGECGGVDLSPHQMIEGLEAVARGCMTTALIFTQHAAAVDLIVRADNQELKTDVCPRAAAGELLLTVGISQLTTSRQGGEPAMRVNCRGSDARFTGLMPWVTSAPHCDMVATGGVLDDGRQLLACLDMDARGITVESPMKLAAMQASATSLVRCENVVCDPSRVVSGPVENALGRRSTVRPLVVSATGVGLAGSIVGLIKERIGTRDAAFSAVAERAIERYNETRKSLYDAADRLGDNAFEPSAAIIRASVNELLMRLAIMLVTVAKGTGFVRGHPAQRLAREAMFFLVWSAPESVQLRTLEGIFGCDG
jgi:butyryl-CoA dehydrogenase